MKGYVLNLIVDHRESKLIQLLEQKKDSITYETKSLDVGDIIVSEDVAIERKTGLFCSLAASKASLDHAYQSTGLLACCSR